jgi:hypothetical protein
MAKLSAHNEIFRFLASNAARDGAKPMLTNEEYPTMIRKGDILSIKPEWRDAGDENFSWVARSDEEKGRVDISALELSEMPIWPMQTVRVDMVEAKRVITLDQFRASGRDCDDLGAALDDCRWDLLDGGKARGRLYLDVLYIERIMHSEGEWSLLLGNCESISNDLPSLEAQLYAWALSEGYCNNF